MFENLVMPPEYHIFEREGKALFFDPKNFIWFVTNSIGKLILEKVDAGLDLESVTQAVCETLQDESQHKKVPEFIENYLAQLKQVKFIHDGEYEQLDWHSGVLESPVILYIHLTSKCNLKCPYCYNQDHRNNLLQKKEEEGSFSDFINLIDQTAEIGIREVKLTGGEALLFKGVLAIAEHAKSKGMAVNLLTNATIMNKEIAEKIARVVDSVSISLDGARPEMHDPVRGRGTHQKVLNSIGQLRQASTLKICT